MSEEVVPIYIRNAQKVGKIVNVSPSVPANQLY